MSDTKIKPKFPPLIVINGRNYILRSLLEEYKADLVRGALGGQGPQTVSAKGEPDVLVPLKSAAKELGVCTRTMSRRRRASKEADAAHSVAA